MSVFISAPHIPWASSSSNPNWSLQEDKDKYIRGRNLGYIAASDPLYHLLPTSGIFIYVQYQKIKIRRKKLGKNAELKKQP